MTATGNVMQGTKQIAKTGKRMGKKVMASDTTQQVVGAVIDGREGVDPSEGVERPQESHREVNERVGPR